MTKPLSAVDAVEWGRILGAPDPKKAIRDALDRGALQLGKNLTLEVTQMYPSKKEHQNEE